jgi:uncharacterized damage-inducible protein DinB
MEGANRRLRERLAGLSDEEYLWEPAAGCWSVRRREAARSSHPLGGGDWVFDYALEDPDPPPFTTIAWRLMHLTDVLGGYRLVLGGGAPTDTWMEPTPVAAAGIALWNEQATAFLRALEDEDDESLQRSVQVPWWPEAAPRWAVVVNVVTEAIHHGAEIGVLRDLYARRDDVRGA